MSIKEEVYKLLSVGKSNREIADTLNVTIRAVQKHKRTYEQGISEQKANTPSERRRKKEIIKAHIESGASIREVSDKFGQPKSTIGDLSKKHNLQQRQADFLRQLAEEEKERIRSNKKKRLEVNTRILEVVAEEVESGKFKGNLSKSTVEKLKLTEEIEQSVLEKDRVDRLERFEFEKEKYRTAKMIAMIEKVEGMTDEELEELEAYFAQKEIIVVE